MQHESRAPSLVCYCYLPRVSTCPILSPPGSGASLAPLGVLPPLRAVVLVIVSTEPAARGSLHPTGARFLLHGYLEDP